MTRVVGGILLLLGVSFALFSFMSDDITEQDKQLEEMLLRVQELSRPVRDLLPGDWDYVCYIDPYSYPSESLNKRLPVALPGLRILPADRWVDEPRWGLAFVSKTPAQARVFLIRNKSIYRFEGPWCVTREVGVFNVETVAAPNFTYKSLTLARDDLDVRVVKPIPWLELIQ